MPADEKVRLLQELLDEIAEVADDPGLTAVEQRLLNERLLQHEDDPEDVEEWESVSNRILREL